MIVSLTPLPDFAPVPRVEIRIEPMLEFDGGAPGTVGAPLLDGGSPGSSGPLLDGGDPSLVLVDLPVGTDRITLWRRCQGRALKVRGAVDRAFVESVNLLDFEAGFDVASTYEVECFGGGMPLGRVVVGATVLAGPSEKYATLIQQPLDPSLNVLVEESDVNVSSVERSAPGGSVGVMGRSYPTVVSAGPRGGVTGAELQLVAKDRATADAVWATLGTEDRPQLPIWLVRSRHPLLPAVFFTDAYSLRESGVNLHVGGSQSVFSLVANEVAPPAPALVVSPLTYDDLDAVFASYTARDAAFASYNEMDAAWQYAGAAGGV